MNVIDLLLGIFLLLGLVRGFFKGFFVELAGIVSLIAGIYAAIHFSDGMYAFLESFISWEGKYLSLLSFATTFFLVVLIISIMARMLTGVVNLLALGILNRIFGGVFGLLKMAFLASIFFYLISKTEVAIISEESRNTSVLYLPVARLAPIFLPSIIEEVKEGEIFETSPEE